MSRLALGLALIVATLLLGLVVHRAPPVLDLAIMQGFALRPNSAGWAVSSAQWVTRLGDPGVRPLLIVAFGVWLLARVSRRNSFVFALGSLAAILFSTWLKEAYLRQRPHVVPWLDHPANYSFPSGHATSVMAILLLFALLGSGRWRVPLAFAVAAAVGVSRVLLGVHWPSDVLGGWLLGAGVALVACHLGQAFGSGARPGRRR